MSEHAPSPDRTDATHRCDLLCPVAHVMRSGIKFLDPESTLRTASQTMLDQQVGAVVVLGPEGPTSIVTEYDLVKALSEDADPDTVWAADVESSPVVRLPVESTIADAAQAMVVDCIRNVPITQHGEVVGFVTIDDVLAVFGRDWVR